MSNLNIVIQLNIQKKSNLVDIAYHHYYKYNLFYLKVKYQYHLVNQKEYKYLDKMGHLY